LQNIFILLPILSISTKLTLSILNRSNENTVLLFIKTKSFLNLCYVYWRIKTWIVSQTSFIRASSSAVWSSQRQSMLGPYGWGKFGDSMTPESPHKSLPKKCSRLSFWTLMQSFLVKLWNLKEKWKVIGFSWFRDLNKKTYNIDLSH